MIRKRVNDQSGFTLVESMVALAILGITLGACVMGFSLAMRGVGTARNQMAAMHYTRDELEGLRTLKFTNSVLNAGTYAISNANYKGAYTVTSVDSYIKDITVRIAYLNRVNGKISTNTLTTSLVKTLH